MISHCPQTKWEKYYICHIRRRNAVVLNHVMPPDSNICGTIFRKDNCWGDSQNVSLLEVPYCEEPLSSERYLRFLNLQNKVVNIKTKTT